MVKFNYMMACITKKQIMSSRAKGYLEKLEIFFENKGTGPKERLVEKAQCTCGYMSILRGYVPKTSCDISQSEKRGIGYRSPFSRYPKDSGLTLLEVMVAMVILGISVALTMQLFAGALSNTALSRHYTEAIFLARHKLEELGLDNQLKSGNQSGNFEGEYEKYSWQAEVSPYALPQPIEMNEEAARPELLQIKLVVSWEERGKTKKVELVTLDASIQPAEGI